MGHQKIVHPGDALVIGPAPDVEIGKVIVAPPVVPRASSSSTQALSAGVGAWNSIMQVSSP